MMFLGFLDRNPCQNMIHAGVMGACHLEVDVCGARIRQRIDAKQVALTHDRRISMVPLLSIRDAAKLLGISESTMRTMTERCIVPHYRVGTGRGAIRISSDDLEVYLACQRHETVPDRIPQRRSRVLTIPHGTPSRHFRD
jgi:excisionase family DNA binding protein